MSKLIRAFSILAVCAALSGCVIVPEHEAYYPQHDYYRVGCFHCSY